MEVFFTSCPIWKKRMKRTTIHQYFSEVQAFTWVLMGSFSSLTPRAMDSSVMRSLVK